MIRIWYSNYLEELVEGLVENVRALREAGAADPFVPTTVIVPNRNIATYLKFAIARRTGVVANWQFQYLYRFFHEALVPQQGPAVQVLGKDDLHGLLIEMLGDAELLQHAELRAVASYLAAADDLDARDRRRWQLASELAHVFEEYSLSRPRMLDLWAKRRVITEEPFASTEEWQRRLWLELFAPDGRVNETARRVGKRLVLLPDALQKLPATSLDLPPQVHVFGLSYVARSFYKLFAELSERTHVLVYTLNPCMEYWEDVPSGWHIGHAKRFQKRSTEQSTLFLQGDDVLDDSPPALRAWGRPGRENISLLNMLTECDFASRFVDPTDAGDTVLHRLQRDILVRQPVSREPDRSYDDDSITFLECPNIQREVEVVANEILDLVRKGQESGDRLNFHDIAVIVPQKERDAYQARIRAVFKATWNIPHNIIDITASAHRRFIEAIELLLDLPFGQFKRRELLRLLTHDNVVAKCPGVDPQTWVRWCTELNILHGADHADHEGTYIRENLYNWDQGLKRLVLGTFMTGAAAGEERIVSMPDGQYLPLETSPGEMESAAKLVSLARSLIADARWLAGASMPMARWMEVLSELVHGYLEPVSDDDEFDRVRVTRFFARFAERTLTTKPVSYRIAYEFVKAELAALEISRGQYLSEGVVVSSFLPMRPIPFKVVFVMGMGERNFPRSDVRSPLDLRWSPELHPQKGDVVSARAQDEYMFLETLVSTRERLYLSYVSRDSQTGEALEPSSVVRLLSFILEQNYVTREVLDAHRREFPLRRWDQEPPNYQLEAMREATAKAMRVDLEKFAAAQAAPYPTLALLDRDLDETQRDELHVRLGIHAVEGSDAPTAETERDVTVSLSQIRKFLESPIQGAASFFLGMREDDFEDPFGVEDEVFETDSQHRLQIMRAAFLSALSSPGTAIEQHYAELARRAVLRGTVPAGPFGEADRNKHVQVLRQWLENWRALGIEDPPTVVNFGRVTEHHASVDVREPLRLEVDVDELGLVDVQVVGKTEVLSLGAATSVVLSPNRSMQRDGGGERPFLRGFLDQVILAAAGVAPDREWRVAVNLNRALNEQYNVRRFDPFDREQARRYLATIIGDMLMRVPAYFLPIEAIFAHRYSGKKRSLERWVDEYRDSWAWCSFKSGPVHDPQARFDLPAHADVYIERRFGPYFARRHETGS